MIANYSKQSGIVQATVDTFSGERPCHLCTKITDAKRADQSRTPAESLPAPEKYGKLLQEIIPATLADLRPPFAGDAPGETLPADSLERHGWVASPPVPPPRMVG